MHRSRHRYQFDESSPGRRLSESWTAPPLTLKEARAGDVFVVLWGEYGASTYLVAAAKEIQCSQDRLEDVLAMLDKNGWNDFRNAGTSYMTSAEAMARVKHHHVRVGAGEVWIAHAVIHLADAAMATFSEKAVGDC